jgi:hypothetical protein
VDQGQRLRDKLIFPAVSFLLLGVLFFAPFLVQIDSFIYPAQAIYSDLTTTHWPNAFFLAESLSRYGQVPLWRPLIMSGTPFAANPLSGLFYPPNLLLLLLPLGLAFKFLLVLHVALAGLGTYLLLRLGFGVGLRPALFSGAAYMLTPKLIAHLGAGHVGLVEALAWLPLAFLLAMLSWRRRSTAAAVGIGVVLALQFFADVRIAFYTALLLAAYSCLEIGFKFRISSLKFDISHLRFVLAAIVFLLLISAELLPLLELAALSARRNLTLAEVGVFPLSWGSLLGLLIPPRGGNHEMVVYIGFLPLFLAGLALAVRRDRDSLFLGGVALLALLLALGCNAPLFPLLYRALPGLGWLRVPSRFWFLALFALIILAGMGLERLGAGLASEQARRRFTMISFSLLAFCLLLGGGLAFVYLPLLANGIHLAFFSLLGMGLLLAWVNGRLPSQAATALALAVLLADLWLVGFSFLQAAPADEVFARGEDVAYYLSARSREEGWRFFRVYSPSYSLPQQVGALWRMEQVDGVDPTQLADYVAFMRLAGGYDHDGYSVTLPPFPEGLPLETALAGARPDAALLGLLNARYVVASFPVDVEGLALQLKLGRTHIYRNERAMPRAWVMYEVERVADGAEALKRLREIDPAQTALVEGGKALDGPAAYREAAVESYTPNRIVVSAELEREGLLVLSEVWYPGWVAQEDGRALPIYKVDGLLRGVYLGPGAQRVEFTYTPAPVLAGAALSALGLAVVMAYFLLSRWFDIRRRSKNAIHEH